MTQQNLSAPESAQINPAEPLYEAAAAVRDQLREPTDLEVAVSVAQQLLDSNSVLSLREALRLLLRAIGAETSEPHTVRHANGLAFTVIPADSYTARMARDVRQLTMDDGTVWTVGTRGAGSTIAWRPAAAEPPALRCPAAHPEDPTPCGGPVVVTVLDRGNAGADGCEHHAARLLASLDGGRVYPLPDAPNGAATRTFKTASTLRPYAWLEGQR
ncbi:hypothetical protein GCM10010294_67910 [Streptomyces griseoloalbus]|uniref:hypothetical protein n=1 Tax=Streptomyces griseoloalbus TaxID=67303 RepID=UPI00199C5BCE|nr:hypothetical protein GCM10010294_67910 [Streptomyces griseoloalbus]